MAWRVLTWAAGPSYTVRPRLGCAPSSGSGTLLSRGTSTTVRVPSWRMAVIGWSGSQVGVSQAQGHGGPQPQAPRLPHGQTGASVPHPSPPLLSGRLGLGESLRTWGLKGPRAPHSPGSDHRPLEICTYGLGQPLSHRGLPSPPAPGIPAKPALPHSSTLTRTRGCG